MAARFKLRRGTVAPLAANLEDYELGLNATDSMLYTRVGGVIKAIKVGDTNSLGGVLASKYLRNDITGTLTGNLTVTGTVYSTAQKALYADVAENYETDREYLPGTVLMFGTDTEATKADGTRPIIGVVSTNPAYLLNDGIQAAFFAPVALAGRIPVRVSGFAKRGDYILLDSAGIPSALSEISYKDDKTFIGIAVSDSVDGVVEVKV